MKRQVHETSKGASARRLLALLLVALLVAVSSVAAALTKDELFSLKQANVPDAAIISVLKSSGPLNLTQDDVKKLKDMNASAELLKFLQDNGHVLAGGGGGGGGDVAPADGEVAPAEMNPDAMAEEAERRKKEEEARIRAEAERLRQQENDRKGKETEIKRQVAKLTDADRALASGRNMAAAKIYLEFLNLEEELQAMAEGMGDAKEDFGGEFYRARFGLAKALFNEGVYSGAAGPLLDVMLAGPEKPHFVEGFYMLRQLTRENGYAPPQLSNLTSFYVENLEPAFQDDFHYYLGRFFYDYKKLDLAFKYLEKVREDSPVKAAALYLTGVAQIDPEVKKFRSAVENFQNAILTAERIDESDPEIRELAYLALARVAYEATNYDGALFYYNKISRTSPRRATALFESSWTSFLKNDYNRAMGSFHSLHSPYYEQWYYPDLYVLEATVYLNLCKFEVAKQALSTFKARYLDQQPLLQNFLQNTLKPEDYYNAVASKYERAGSGEDVGLPMIYVQGVYNNADFFNNYRVISNLGREEAKLEANIGALGEFGQKVLDRVKKARQTQLLKAGIEVQQILSKMDQELTEWSIKADEIDFEIDGSRAEEAKRALVNPDYVPPSATVGTTLFVVADDWQYWPFEGEYWVDEIGNYRSFLANECIEEK
jgi:hypothetical protein